MSEPHLRSLESPYLLEFLERHYDLQLRSVAFARSQGLDARSYIASGRKSPESIAPFTSDSVGSFFVKIIPNVAYDDDHEEHHNHMTFSYSVLAEIRKRMDGRIARSPDESFLKLVRVPFVLSTRSGAVAAILQPEDWAAGFPFEEGGVVVVIEHIASGHPIDAARFQDVPTCALPISQFVCWLQEESSSIIEAVEENWKQHQLDYEVIHYEFDYDEWVDEAKKRVSALMDLGLLSEDEKMAVGKLCRDVMSSGELVSETETMVICHADLHEGNILEDDNGMLWILDWDFLIMSPRERDFIPFRKEGFPLSGIAIPRQGLSEEMLSFWIRFCLLEEALCILNRLNSVLVRSEFEVNPMAESLLEMFRVAISKYCRLVS